MDKMTQWNELLPFLQMKTRTRLYGEKISYYEDVLQECYIQFEEAIKNYQEDRGKSFAGYFIEYYYPRAMNAALYGGRNKQQKEDPITSALSLDAPAGNEADITLADTILDGKTEAYLRKLEDESFWRFVGNLIRAGAGAGDDLPAKIICTMLSQNCSLKEARNLLGGGEEEAGKYYEAYRKGCRRVYRYINAYIAKHRYTADTEELQDCLGGGLAYYKGNQFTSRVEAVAISRADRDLKVKHLEKIIKYP